jgi:hypothetical protein
MRTFEEHRRELESQTYRSTRRWSEGHITVGLLGERAFARMVGVRHDLRSKPLGDGGSDQTLFFWGIDGTIEKVACDVKSARKATWLLVNRLKVKPRTIYVLSQVNASLTDAEIIGWEWGSVVMKAPTKFWSGNDAEVHYILASELRKPNELTARCIQAERDR